MGEDELDKIVRRLRRSAIGSYSDTAVGFSSNTDVGSATKTAVRSATNTAIGSSSIKAVGSETNTDVGSSGGFKRRLGLPTATGYWSALSPLATFIKKPPSKKPAGDIVVIDEDEVSPTIDSPVLSTNNKRHPMTLAERQKKFRDAKKRRVDQTRIRGEDRVELFSSLRRNCHKGNQYDAENLAFLIRSGTCPSAAGARDPMASICSRF